MKLVIAVFIMVLSFFAVRPLLMPGFFPMHDDTQVQRVHEMNVSLKGGMVPVRWVPDLGYGYGYPIFNFYAPLAYYVGGGVNYITDSLTATKAMMVIGIVLSGVTMYFFAREFFGDFGGMVSGVAYMFAPYHALDIYVRGDVSEFFAYAFIPLAFYGVYKATTTLSWRYVALGSIGYAGVILSHNLTALMMTPFLLVFVVMMAFFSQKKTKKVFLFSFLPVILGVGLSAFYSLPVFFEMRYTDVLSVVGGGSHFADHFVCLPQLWSGTWGYLGSVPGCIDGMSLQVGKIHLFSAILALVITAFLFLKRKKDQGILRLMLVSSLIGFFFCLFLVTSSSELLWRVFPTMAFFQFPWRFLLMATFFASFLSGSIALIPFSLPRKELFVGGLCIFFSLCIVIFYGKYFIPQKMYSFTEKDYINEHMLKYVASKISDEYMPPHFRTPETPLQIVRNQAVLVSGAGEIAEEKNSLKEKEIRTVATTPVMLLMKIAPFPTWKAQLDGTMVLLRSTDEGYLLSVPQGEHSVRFFYSQTPVQIAANSLSVASILILIAVIIYRPAKKLYEKKD